MEAPAESARPPADPGQDAPLAMALAAARTSIWDYDMASGVVCFDIGWSRMRGGPAEATRTTIRKVFALVHPEERAHALRSVQDCLIGVQDGYDCEYRIRHESGGWLWVHSRGRVTLREPGGRALRLMGTNTDVTARKTAELNLAREAGFLSALNQLTLSLLQQRGKTEVLSDLATKTAALFGEGAQVEVALLECGELTTHACGGPYCSRPGTRVRREENAPAWQAMDTRQPVIVEHPPSSASSRPPIAFGASAIFPIVLEARALGILTLRRPGPGHSLTPDDQAKGMLLAQLAALVLNNATIYEDALRRAEERTADLRDREEQYRQVVENINQGFYTANARSIFTYCNPAISLVTGLKPESLLGTSSFRLVAEADRARVVTLYREWVAGPQQHTVTEFRVEQPGGRFIWVEQLTQIVRHGDGRVAEFRNFLRDITTQKAATDALRESEARFHGVFAKSPVAIALLTYPEGQIVEINDTSCRLFRIPRNLAIGHTSTAMGIWVDLTQRDAYLEQLRTHGFVESFEARLRRADGSTFTGLYTGSVITIGGREYSLNSIQDISAQKAAEAALRESESLFRTLADVAPVGIFSTDAAGRTVFVNHRWCEIAGIKPDEALDERWIQAVHPEDRPGLAAGWAEAVRTGTATTTRFRFLKRDGTTTFLVGHSRPQLDATGRITGHVGTITDITSLHLAEESRRRTEIQLRQAQKMESLGTLAGGIAHDFNNILTGMLGFVELIRLDLPPGHPAHEWIRSLAGSGERAKNLVRQILTFSRKHESERAPLRLEVVAEEAVRLLRATIPAMISIRTDLPRSCPPILADSNQLHQVMLNLCTNAWHALPAQDGFIGLAVTPVALAPGAPPPLPDMPPGPYVCLTVSDNGTGMAPETIERIFDPFFTTKKTGTGTGLGLAVVHGIVESHDGFIKVQSTLGEGTRFDLFFPALSPAEPSVEAPALAIALDRGAGEHCLLVDDDTASAEVIARLLQRLGYRVTLRHDPIEALACFRAAPGDFAIVISDLAMPRLTGIQFAAEIRQTAPAIPILMISGYVTPAQQQELRALGMTELLRKPPTVNELAQTVARCVGRPGQ